MNKNKSWCMATKYIQSKNTVCFTLLCVSQFPCDEY